MTSVYFFLATTLPANRPNTEIFKVALKFRGTVYSHITLNVPDLV